MAREQIKERLIEKIKYADDDEYLAKLENFIHSSGFKNPKWLFLAVQKSLGLLGEKNMELLLLLYYYDYDRQTACAILEIRDLDFIKNAEKIYILTMEKEIPKGYSTDLPESTQEAFYLSLIKYAVDKPADNEAFEKIREGKREVQKQICKYQKRLKANELKFRTSRNLWRVACIVILILTAGFTMAFAFAEEFRNTVLSSAEYEDHVDVQRYMPKSANDG